MRIAAESIGLISGLARLWSEVFEKEMRRIASESETSHRDCLTLWTLAFRSLANRSSFLSVYSGLESRLQRRLESAVAQLDSIRWARLRQPEKRECDVRTPEIIEITSKTSPRTSHQNPAPEPGFAEVAEGASSGLVGYESANICDRTSEPVEKSNLTMLGKPSDSRRCSPARCGCRVHQNRRANRRAHRFSWPTPQSSQLTAKASGPDP